MIGEWCQFVYIDSQGDLLTACCVGQSAHHSGFGTTPDYVIFRAENEMEYTTTDPDLNYECLGEL